MSWSEYLPPPPARAAALPLRELILGALAEAFITRRAGAAFCADCQVLQRLCPDHREDFDLAAQYEAAYTRILGIGTDGAMLTLLGGLP